MDTADRWETASVVLFNVAYTVAVAAMVLLMVPPVRAGLARWSLTQLHAWRYGRWLQGRTRPPQWTELLARDDLPAEAS